jgi:LysR family glycine cleavage system transcriptional activator
VQPLGPTLDAGRYFLAAAKGREREPAIRAVWQWIAAQALAGQ